MLIQAFFAGFFLFNSLPHLIKGITGQTHMTPIKRVSSPMLNVAWSFANIIIGLFILGFDPLVVTRGENLWAFLAGGIIVSFTAAWLFGRPNARLPWHKD